MKTFLVRDIANTNQHRQNYLKLKFITGDSGMERSVKKIDLNRPGLALSGYFKNFGSDRIQIFGRGEEAYLQSLSHKEIRTSIDKLFMHDLNFCIFTHGVTPPLYFIKQARRISTPIAISTHTTSDLITLLTELMEEWLAPTVNSHGVLMEVFGIGVMIIGKSGIGKSETALELVKRGHQFIADDVVRVRKVKGTSLIGTSHDLLRHKMEIRGLGIIDVERVFGIGAIKESKRIDIVIKLESWDKVDNSDRLGIKRTTSAILGIKVPYIILPVKEGRNIPVIIETSTLDMKLKETGYNACKELTGQVRKGLKNKKEVL